MINTYNESNLHNTLKKLYALEFNGHTEQKEENFIFDVITDTKDIIEIQTSNISKLRKKIEYAIKNDRNIRIIHPLIQTKIIETYSQNGDLLSRRKSPKSECFISMLKELTGIYDLLLDNHLTLEIVTIDAVEIHIKTQEPVQTANKSRRHFKNYINKEKKLMEIKKKKIFKNKNDYLSLIPETTPENFTPPLLLKQLQEQEWPEYMSKSNIKKECSNYRIMIWLYEKMNIFEKTGKTGRSWNYKINL